MTPVLKDKVEKVAEQASQFIHQAKGAATSVTKTSGSRLGKNANEVIKAVSGTHTAVWLKIKPLLESGKKDSLETSAQTTTAAKGDAMSHAAAETEPKAAATVQPALAPTKTAAKSAPAKKASAPVAAKKSTAKKTTAAKKTGPTKTPK